jgi:hypothetical protein
MDGDDAIHINRQFDSNEIDESYFQNEQQNEQRISTLRGIKIIGSDEATKADDSIPVNREGDSKKLRKVTYGLRPRMNSKFQHCMESKSIEVIMMKMQMIQFVSIVKLTNVIGNLKNMKNNEFQDCIESRLFEVMNLQMQMIQSQSIVNLIQLKLMKVIYETRNRMNNEFQHCMESKSI